MMTRNPVKLGKRPVLGRSEDTQRSTRSADHQRATIIGESSAAPSANAATNERRAFATRPIHRRGAAANRMQCAIRHFRRPLIRPSGASFLVLPSCYRVFLLPPPHPIALLSSLRLTSTLPSFYWVSGLSLPGVLPTGTRFMEIYSEE